MTRTAVMLSVMLSAAIAGYAAGASARPAAAASQHAQQPPHAALLTGAYWSRLTPAAKQAYLSGFIAGAAAEQARAVAESEGKGGDSAAVSSAAIERLRTTRALRFRFTPAVYSAQVDDFYWWSNHADTPIVDAMIFFNTEMLKQQAHDNP
jgi:hypothetical protein